MTNTTAKPTAPDVRPGAGDDIFVAGGATPTLNSGDTLDGMGGLNTLRIHGAKAGLENFSAANIKNIQTVEFYSATGAADDLDVSGNADVKTVIGVNALAGATAQEMTATLAQTVGFKGAMAVTQTVTFKDVTGSADKATIMLDGASAATGLTVTTGIEDLTFATAGKNDVNTLTAGTVKSLSVTGTGSFDAALAASPTNKLDTVLSTTSGDVTLDLSASGVLATAGKYSITTGAGNDNITIGSADLVKAAKINLGDGTADTLTIVNSGAYAVTADALSGVTGVETLGFKTDNIVTLDAGKVGTIDDFVFTTSNAAGGFAVSNAISGTTITLNGTSTAFAASTVGVPTGGSGNSLNLILNGGATAADEVTVTTGAGLTVEQTKVNITSTHVANSALTNANALKLTVAAGSDIKIDGGHDLTLTTATGINLAISATDFTGKLAVTGSAGKDTITGGHGDDTIKTGGGFDTLTGNAGKDAFDVSTSKVGNISANSDLTTMLVKITDFVKSETIDLSTADNVNTTIAKVTMASGQTLDQQLRSLVTADATSKPIVSWFTDNTHSYIVCNAGATDTTTDDTIVQVAGVTDLTGIAVTATGVLSWA